MSRKPWWVTISPAELVALRQRLMRTLHARFGQTLGSEIEDAVHQAFVALLRNRESISSDNDGLYRYLLVASRRSALDRIKTQNLRSRRRDALPKPVSDLSPLVEVLLREEKSNIRRFFDELDELDRLIVWRYVVDGQSVNALAQELNLGWHRVDATITRVLAALRRLLVD